MRRGSGKRRIPGSIASTVDDYHQSIAEFLVRLYLKRTHQRFACSPPPTAPTPSRGVLCRLKAATSKIRR